MWRINKLVLLIIFCEWRFLPWMNITFLCQTQILPLFRPLISKMVFTVSLKHWKQILLHYLCRNFWCYLLLFHRLNGILLIKLSLFVIITFPCYTVFLLPFVNLSETPTDFNEVSVAKLVWLPPNHPCWALGDAIIILAWICFLIETSVKFKAVAAFKFYETLSICWLLFNLFPLL